MGKIFTEENGQYQIDCSKAVWATDELDKKIRFSMCRRSRR